MMKLIPDGSHAVNFSLGAKDPAKAIEFYQNVFGAKEALRLADASGMIAHAEIDIGDTRIFLGPESKEWGQSQPGDHGLVAGRAPSLCRRRRRGRPARSGRRREDPDSGSRPVLWRSSRKNRRSLRPSVVGGHAQGRRVSRGDGSADAGVDEEFLIWSAVPMAPL